MLVTIGFALLLAPWSIARRRGAAIEKQAAT
jgi:hypothetical protein